MKKSFPKNEMSYVLNKLNTKKDVDNAIKSCEDKVLVLRFGRDADTVCQQLDDIVRKCDSLSILDDNTAIIACLFSCDNYFCEHHTHRG